MKRFVVLFALVVVFALLVACAAPTPEPTKPPAPAPTQPPAPVATKAPAPAQPTPAPQPTATPAKKVEVTFWKHSHTPADELTKKLIEEYQAKNPNVTIKMELIPN